MKLRINFTISRLGYSGGVRTFYEIGKRLIKKCHKVTITTVRVLSKNYPWETFVINKPLFFKHALNYLIFNKVLSSFPYYIFNEQEVIRKKIPDCDINVATSFLTALPVYRSQKGLLFYHIQHDEELFYGDSYHKILAQESYSLPFDAKIANSSWLRSRLKEKCGVETILIHHAIANEVFYPRKIERNGGKKRVICFGKGIEWKGFKDALETMKIVFKKRSDVEWFVYGTSSNLPQDTDASYSFVYFPSDDELAKLYSSADIVICPSWYESFPAPPLEAMACGAPVVTTKYGTEDYAINEENALVVPPRRPKIMAEAILRLLEDKNLSDRLRENGPKVAKQFTWDKTTDKVEKLFFSKLNEKKDHPEVSNGIPDWKS